MQVGHGHISQAKFRVIALQCVQRYTPVSCGLYWRLHEANSFIVTGILESPSHSDNKTVFELCASELGIEVDIIACKRLGRVLSERRHPILVVCKSADCVAGVLACAKLLQNSVDPEVKRMVYINPSLTKAEA